MITGFRWHIGGAQKVYGISPDLSTFGKGMGNGFSVSALAGKRELMELGGLHHDRERVFLLSTTHGAENHSLAASIQTMQIYRRENVIEFFYQQGERLRTGIDRVIESLGLGDYFQLLGRPSNLVYATRDQSKQPSQAFRALFLQETIKRGLLAPSLVVSFSHTDADIDRTIEAIGESLQVYRRALEDGVEHFLIGRPVKPVFRKFN
jgi:glutamate-1-semialdehyde 2,1-aminomutase